MDSDLQGSAVHRIFQARILEWAAISFAICIITPFQISSFLPPCPPEAWAHGPERHPGIQKHEGEVPIGGEGKSLGWGLPLEGPSVFPGLVDWAFTGDLEPDPRPPGGPQTPSETGGPRGRLRGPQVITSPGSHKPGSCL